VSHLHHKVSALVDGELSAAARARAVKHILGCDACRQEVEQTLNLKRRLGGLAGVEPSGDMFVRLGTLPQGHTEAEPRRRFSHGRKVGVGVGSMSMAVITLAYVVGGAEPTSVTTVTPPIDEFAAEFAKETGAAPLSDPAVEAMNASTTAYTVSATTSSPVRVQAVASSRPAVDPPVGWAPQAGPGDDVAAVEALERAVLAPDRVAYRGVRAVVDMTGEVASAIRVHVEHVPGQGTSFDVTGSPGKATATFVAEGEAASSQGFASGQLQLLIDAYDLTASGITVVAGRPATVISVRRGTKLLARFFVDNETALMLRREMYDGGELVRSSTFQSLRTSPQGFISHLPPELGTPATTAVSTQLAPILDDDGYACPTSLSETFEMTTLNRLHSQGDVIHATYSDGLSSVSLFEQRGQLEADSLDGFRRVGIDGAHVAVREGLPTVAIWESEGTVYTMVTDSPMSASVALIAELPHRPPVHEDPSNRLVRGFETLGTSLTSLTPAG